MRSRPCRTSTNQFSDGPQRLSRAEIGAFDEIATVGDTNLSRGGEAFSYVLVYQTLERNAPGDDWILTARAQSRRRRFSLSFFSLFSLFALRSPRVSADATP